jgi:uncharacterized protein
MEKIRQDKIEEIAKKYGLKLLLLFGSQVSGKTHPMSDFDFGYIGKKELNYKEKSELANELSKLVKFLDVEVVDLKKSGPFLLKEIIKNNQVLFQEEGAYADFYTASTRIYFDAEPIFKLQEIIYSNTINKYKRQYAK